MIFRKKIETLTPVVAMAEDIIIFGRYKEYNKDNEMHVVYDETDNMFYDCNSIKILTEDEYIKYLKLYFQEIGNDRK